MLLLKPGIALRRCGRRHLHLSLSTLDFLPPYLSLSLSLLFLPLCVRCNSNSLSLRGPLASALLLSFSRHARIDQLILGSWSDINMNMSPQSYHHVPNAACDEMAGGPHLATETSIRHIWAGRYDFGTYMQICTIRLQFMRSPLHKGQRHRPCLRTFSTVVGREVWASRQAAPNRCWQLAAGVQYPRSRSEVGLTSSTLPVRRAWHPATCPPCENLRPDSIPFPAEASIRMHM